MELRKQGAYYTIDALIGALLIFFAVTATTQLIPTQTQPTNKYLAEDFNEYLATATVEEFNASYAATQNNVENETTLLDHLGYLWATNNTAEYNSVLQSIQQRIPDTNTALDVEYNETTSQPLTTSTRMITGIEQNQPVSGYSATMNLLRPSDIIRSTRTYFGGYAGQGNLTKTFILPDDFNTAKHRSSSLQAVTPGTFDVYINTDYCTSIIGSNATAQRWSLNTCSSSFQPGTNKLELISTTKLNKSYLSGGYLLINYLTDQATYNSTKTTERVYLTGIEGFLNLYDALTFQETPVEYDVNITVNTPYESFLRLGDTDILTIPGTNTTQTLTAFNLTVPSGVTTYPLRLGVEDVGNLTIIGEGQPTDTYIATDVSGSMGNCASSTGPCPPTRLDVAKDADKLAVDIILNASLTNRIGLVDYSGDAYTPLSLTNDTTALKNEIDTYSDGGATCICCGLNRARMRLESEGTPDRKQFMIFLSDGDPTQKCSSTTDYTGTPGWYWWVPGTAESTARDAADAVCANNVTLYTITTGDGVSSGGKALMEDLACNASNYFDVSNTTQLVDVYENISQDILIEANYTSQTIEIQGDVPEMTLSPTSYIDITYANPIYSSTEGAITSVTHRNLPGCYADITIPETLQVQRAEYLSYSDSKWTKSLIVNNNEVYNLTQYGVDYPSLGDPFSINVPTDALNTGTNYFNASIGITPQNSSMCGSNNTVTYDAYLKQTSTRRTPALPRAAGCTWTIEHADGSTYTYKVPGNYTGNQSCTYTSTQILYDTEDAYQVATHNLLQRIDPFNTGTTVLNLNTSQLTVNADQRTDVPYLWGPTLVHTTTRR